MSFSLLGDSATLFASPHILFDVYVGRCAGVYPSLKGITSHLRDVAVEQFKGNSYDHYFMFMIPYEFMKLLDNYGSFRESYIEYYVSGLKFDDLFYSFFNKSDIVKDYISNGGDNLDFKNIIYIHFDHFLSNNVMRLMIRVHQIHIKGYRSSR